MADQCKQRVVLCRVGSVRDHSGHSILHTDNLSLFW